MENNKKIIIKNISKKFKIGFKKNQSALGRLVSIFSGVGPKKDLEILKEVSFDVDRGELLGIIGKNGSGKSSLLRIIAGIYRQNSGQISTNGKIISLINIPGAFKGRLSMKDNIYLIGALFGMPNSEIKRRMKDVIDFSGLEEFLETKMNNFSSGMVQRLVFSIAVHSDPDILLLDEVFEVGDEDFKQKSVQKNKELAKRGVCIILVSHDLDMIKKYCTRVLWLDNGQIVKKGDAGEVIEEYLKCK